MPVIKLITLEEEMKKNPELKMSDIQILKEWCKKQLHLPKIEDVQLALFLHSNYYQIESTKNTIENYYTIRTHVPEFFSNRDIFKEKLRKTFNVTTIISLEGRTKEGYHIGFGNVLDCDPQHYHFDDTAKIHLMAFEEFLFTHGSTIGHILILDIAGVSFGHVARLNPIMLKKFACYVQDAMPVRLKAIHIINTSPIAEMAFNVFKPFVKKEMMELIHFHSSMKSACNYFPVDVLPNECGGKAGYVQDLVKVQLKKIENFHKWYLEDERVNWVNESLRIGESKTNDMFGTHGSFRKIEID